MIRTPRLAPFFTSRLCSPIHCLTSLLTCQLALSHTSTNTFLPAAASSSEHHGRNWEVIPLAGYPSTTRSHVSLNSGTNSPQQDMAFGPGPTLASDCWIRRRASPCPL